MTKIKGLIQDISGAIRVTKMREEAFKNAKDENLYVDPIYGSGYKNRGYIYNLSYVYI